MAATYSKPTEIPRWADTSSNVVEPSEAKKDEGWVYEEIPPSSYENWRTREIGRWFKWIDERLFDGATKDVFVIKEPGGGLEMIRVEDPVADFPTVFLPQGFAELIRTGAGKSAGSRLRFLNADRTAEDDAQWFIRTSGDPDHELAFGFADDGFTGIEEVMVMLAHSSALSLTEPLIAFTTDISLIPLGGGSTNIGLDSYRWSNLFVANIYQTNVAYIFTGDDWTATPVAIPVGGVDLTATTIRLSALMATATSPSRRVTFSRSGIYEVVANITWEAVGANATVAIWGTLNGTVVVGSFLEDHVDGNADECSTTCSFLVQVTNPASDYVEIRGQALVGGAQAIRSNFTAHIVKENVNP